MNETAQLENWRKALTTYRRGVMALEACGAVPLEEARALLQRAGEPVRKAHADAGLCLGCSYALDDPMPGYTSHCGECGASYAHPLPENVQ